MYPLYLLLVCYFFNQTSPFLPEVDNILFAPSNLYFDQLKLQKALQHKPDSKCMTLQSNLFTHLPISIFFKFSNNLIHFLS